VLEKNSEVVIKNNYLYKGVMARSRKVSGYNRFIGEALRQGFTMKEASIVWKSRSRSKKTIHRKKSRHHRSRKHI